MSPHYSSVLAAPASEPGDRSSICEPLPVEDPISTVPAMGPDQNLGKVSEARNIINQPKDRHRLLWWNETTPKIGEGLDKSRAVPDIGFMSRELSPADKLSWTFLSHLH